MPNEPNFAADGKRLAVHEASCDREAFSARAAASLRNEPNLVVAARPRPATPVIEMTPT